ncbi:MAG: hypothetical protein FWG64_04240 [Firmicutes bacterium]|nr:hypothetical protein [Bacillota bacterium]
MIKKVIIILLASTAVVGGAAAAFGPNLARNFAPQFFIARAVLNTSQEFTPFLWAARDILPQVQSQPLQLETSLTINRVDGSLIGNIPAAITPALQLLTIQNTTRLDAAWDNLANSLNLQMAGTTLLNADFTLNRQQLLLNVPAIFDFNLAIDPRRLGSELNESALTGMVLPANLIDDELFYYFYSQLFLQRQQINVQGFINSAITMATNANFEYIGRNEDSHVFRVIPTMNDASTAANFILEGTAFAEDPIIDLGIIGNRLSFATVIANFSINGILTPIYLEIYFTGTGEAEYEILFPNGTVAGNLAVTEQADHSRLNFTVAITTDATATATGTVQLYPQDWRIVGSFANLTITTPDIDITLNGNYSLQADYQPIIFNTAEARTLAQLGIFDLLGGMARLSESPIGGILGDLILP